MAGLHRDFLCGNSFPAGQPGLSGMAGENQGLPLLPGQPVQGGGKPLIIIHGKYFIQQNGQWLLLAENFSHRHPQSEIYLFHCPAAETCKRNQMLPGSQLHIHIPVQGYLRVFSSGKLGQDFSHPAPELVSGPQPDISGQTFQGFQSQVQTADFQLTVRCLRIVLSHLFIILPQVFLLRGFFLNLAFQFFLPALKAAQIPFHPAYRFRFCRFLFAFCIFCTAADFLPLLRFPFMAAPFKQIDRGNSHDSQPCHYSPGNDRDLPGI